MNYNRAAYRYAKATLASCDKNEVTKIFTDMQTVCKAFEDSNELKLFVDSKVIKDSDKLSTLKEVFQQSSKKVFDLMELLMKNRRIDLFDDVAKSFIIIYNHIIFKFKFIYNWENWIKSQRTNEQKHKIN